MRVKKTVLSLLLSAVILFAAWPAAAAEQSEIETGIDAGSPVENVGEPLVWDGSVLSYVDDPFPTSIRPQDRPSTYSESETITSEAVELSTTLYSTFLNADPNLFLLTDEGTRCLNFWDELTQEQMDYVAQKTLSIVEGCTTVDEKIFAVAKYLAQNVCYDHDVLEHGDLYQTNLDAYSVLTKEYTVCSGYAVTYAVMMQILDIPAIYVSAPNHAWNMVHNGEDWMLIDVTWISFSTMRNGIKEKSDSLNMDWYDFSIEEANANYNHTIDTLPLMTLNGVLTEFPKYSAAGTVYIPADVSRIDCWIYGDFATLYLPKSVRIIADASFYCSTIVTTVYEGTSSEYSSISVGAWNDSLRNSQKTYQGYISAPVITCQSTDIMTDKQTPVTLSVTATGTLPLTYQWYVNTSRSNRNGTPIAGATGATYQPPITEDGMKYYYVVVSGGQNVTGRPVMVGVSDEIPSVKERLADELYYLYFEATKELRISGTGEVPESAMDSWKIPSDFNIVRIEAGVTYIPESIAQSYLFWSVAAYIVDAGNPVYANDTAGALINKQEGILMHLPKNSSVTEYEIPEGTVKVLRGALQNKSLTSLHIPASMRSIYDLGESSYESGITVEPGNTAIYYDAQGALINSTDHILLRFSNPENEQAYRVDNSITEIADHAFLRANNLTRVVFPAKMTRMGKKAFMYCGNIPGRIWIPDGITVVEDGTFFDCPGITEVVIPDGVTSIGVQAFGYCDSLKEVMIPVSVEMIDWLAFQSCSNLQKVYYGGTPAQWASIEIDKENQSLLNAEIVFPAHSGKCGDKVYWTLYEDGRLVISGEGAMDNYSERNSAPWYDDRVAITEVTVLGGVTEIGNYAFCNSAVSDVTFGRSLTRVGASSFAGCTTLQGAAFDGNAPVLEEAAFPEETILYYDGTTDGWANVEGAKPLTAPVATQHPRFASITVGEKATFTAAFEGYGLTYRWILYTSNKDWIVIEGATGPVCTLESVRSDLDQAMIWCEAVNEMGSAQTYAVRINLSGLGITTERTDIPGGISVNVYIGNLSDTSASGTVFCAAYDEDGKMLGITSMEMTAENGQEACAELTIACAASKVDSVKTFFVSSAMVPICLNGGC